MEHQENKKSHGSIVNNFYGNVNKVVNNYGTINDNSTTNLYGENVEKQRSYTDEQVAQALSNIVGVGKAIDSKQKWAGALWLLRWECNYPARAQEFCERIKALPLPGDLEFPCDYNNIRLQSTLSFFNQDPRQMDLVKYSPNDQKEFFQFREVAVALLDELRKTNDREIGL